MKAKDFRALFADLGSLTSVQRNALLAALSSRGSAGDVVALIEAEFAKAPACGHCGSEAFSRWGLASGMKRYMRAALDGDWDEFDRACAEVLGYDPEDPESWQLYRSYTIELLTPITTHALFQWSPEVAREAIAFLVRGQKKIIFQEGAKLPKMKKSYHSNAVPADDAMMTRAIDQGL